MKAIVGLGNPGPRYQRTRHNVGWQVVDELARRWGDGARGQARAETGRQAGWPGGEKPAQARHAELVKTAWEGETVLLVKPQTFMNDSGKTVRALVEKDGLEPQDILVVYDDLDLALGRIRIRGTGSAGGHRGIQSIQQHLATIPRLQNRAPEVGSSQAQERLAGSATPKGDSPRKPEPPAFPRLKVGIGRPPAGVDPIDFVLAGFLPDEMALLRPAIQRAADAAECWVSAGTDVAANRFNGM